MHREIISAVYGIMISHEANWEIIKEKNLQLDTPNPALQGGFTQVPNFILKNPDISASCGLEADM